MLLASCAGNEIVAHVLPFITQNIKHDEWKFRDAAVMAFGTYKLFFAGNVGNRLIM